MPIYLPDNPYAGVNAHINSLLQSGGGWAGFHQTHIVYLTAYLDEVLPPGYFTLNEQSLQIRDEVDIPPKSASTTADVAIFGRQTHPQPQSTAPAPIGVIETLPLVETLAAEDFWQAAVIYQQSGAATLPGRPITRIEILSPANKPRGSHHEQYVVKREGTLRGGLCMVEIDYLHELRPAVAGIPSYPDGEPGAYPYNFLVSEPRPTFEDGTAYRYGAAVDDPLPLIRVPLMGDDSVILDLNQVYQRTISASRYYKQAVDYAELPVHFERYQPSDQTRIRVVMAKAAAAAPHD